MALLMEFRLINRHRSMRKLVQSESAALLLLLVPLFDDDRKVLNDLSLYIDYVVGGLGSMAVS